MILRLVLSKVPVVLISASFLFCLPSANAVTIYDNGAPNQASGNEMTGWIQAEDFTLASPAIVTGVTFWDFEDESLAFQGSWTWQIYADNGSNQPGALLSSGTSMNLTHASTGSIVFGFYTEFINTFDITPTALLAGTTYWLGLHNGPLTTTLNAGVFWEVTNLNATNTGKEDEAPFDGSWSENGNEHAFLLTGNAGGGGTGVPEGGSSAVLLILSLAGLLGIKSRRARTEVVRAIS